MDGRLCCLGVPQLKAVREILVFPAAAGILWVNPQQKRRGTFGPLPGWNRR